METCSSDKKRGEDYTKDPFDVKDSEIRFVTHSKSSVEESKLSKLVRTLIEKLKAACSILGNN